MSRTAGSKNSSSTTSKNSTTSKKTSKKSILDSYSIISKTDKNAFVKKANSYDMPEEELLNIAVKAVVKDLIPLNIKKKLVVELDESKLGNKKTTNKKKETAKADEKPVAVAEEKEENKTDTK